jgi:hypothetical protein
MFPEPITPCRCESAGLCSRHQCEKTYAWVLACRLDWQMFQRWENGEGPCVGQIRALVNGEAPPPEPIAELPACRHRGAEPLEFVDCELCGGRNERVPLYSCAYFGKCAPRRYGTRTEIMRQMPSCIRCDKYEVAESTSPDIASTAETRPQGQRSGLACS